MILENKELLVKINTGRGSKIVSFFDKKREKEWVWRPNHVLNMDESTYLDSTQGFDANWTGGFEEVFPNDAPSETESFGLLDHGELWRVPWQQEQTNPLEITCSMNCETYPMDVKKTFKLKEEAPELLISYEIRSRASKVLPFIFKLHPAIKIEPGDTFEMPESNMTPVALEFSRLIGVDHETVFPEAFNKEGEVISINRALPPDGWGREFVRLKDFSEGKCSVHNARTEQKLTLEFPVKIMPYIWLFQSYGGFQNHYVAMMEPTNAGHYDLNVAVKNKECGYIRPEEIISFDITIRLERD